jgi:hypothetical protein
VVVVVVIAVFVVVVSCLLWIMATARTAGCCMTVKRY